MQTKNATREGFTIIEVLIVLAIAGLILLIVFLAVPALQRNSRNQQYKNDAASLLAAAQEFMSSNNGRLPTSSDNNAVEALAKTKSITQVTIHTSNPGNINPTFTRATINTGMKCPATVSGAMVNPDNGPARGMMIVYAIEDAAGNDIAQCLNS